MRLLRSNCSGCRPFTSRLRRLVAMVFCLGISLAAAVRAADSGLPGYVIVPLSNMARSNQACIRTTINGHSTLLMPDLCSTLGLLSA